MALNSRQREAVDYTGGPCLVLAGAGSGKTTVITAKIVHLIRDCGFAPEGIYAVTFTGKAAREMRERAAAALGGAARGVHLSTFHALGLDILRREHAAAGLRRDFTLFDEYDQMAVMRDVLREAGALGGDGDRPGEECRFWLNRIGGYKNDLTADGARDPAAPGPDRLGAEILGLYERTLRAVGAVDFDDLICLTVRMFEENPAVLLRWQNRIRYLLVDEYQDTNAAQYRLVRLLAEQRRRFTAVGDDDQSIYSWRGARPENLGLLRRDFPDLKVVMLEQNYRSCGRILKCANRLIAENSHDFVKTLRSELDFGPKINVVEAPDPAGEAKAVAAELLAHRFRNRARYRDYAVLYRGNHQSAEIQKALRESGIPFRVAGGASFFALPEIRDFMGYLRVIVNGDDDRAFLRVINVPRREIGPASLAALGAFAGRRRLSLFDACGHPALAAELKSRPAGTFRKFHDQIAAVRRELRGPGWEACLGALPETLGYSAWLGTLRGEPGAAAIRRANVRTLIGWVIGAVRDGEGDPAADGPVSGAVGRLCVRELLDRTGEDGGPDEVQLMTLHASKGLEFPCVFLVGMEEGILPHETSVAENAVEEERRLAYVGITRAKRDLYLTYCKSRGRGTGVPARPSRFLFELPAEDLHWPARLKDTRTEEEKRENIDNLFEQLLDSLKR